MSLAEVQPQPYAETVGSPVKVTLCSEVFEEDLAPPSGEEVLEYAARIGIDPETEPHLLPLAQRGLMQKLPPGWHPCYDENLQRYYYFNNATGESRWEHPLDEVYRDIVRRTKSTGSDSADNSRTSIKEDLLGSLEELDQTDYSGASDMLPRTLEPLRVAGKLEPLKSKSPANPSKVLKPKGLTLGGAGASFLRSQSSLDNLELGRKEEYHRPVDVVSSRTDPPPKGILRDGSQHSRLWEMDVKDMTSEEKRLWRLQEMEADKKSIKFNLDVNEIKYEASESEDNWNSDESDEDKIVRSSRRSSAEESDVSFGSKFQYMDAADLSPVAKKTSSSFPDKQVSSPVKTAAIGDPWKKLVLKPRPSSGKPADMSSLNLTRSVLEPESPSKSPVKRLLPSPVDMQPERVDRGTEWTAAKAKIESEVKKKRDALEKELQAELEKREQELRSAMTASIEKVRKEVEETKRKELEKLEKEKDMVMKDSKFAIAAEKERVKAQQEADVARLRSELETKRKREVEEMRAQFEKELDEARRKIKARHAEDLNEIEARQKTDLQEALKVQKEGMKREHQIQLDRLKDYYKDVASRKESELKEEKVRLEKEMQVVKENHQHLLDDLFGRHEEELSQMKRDVAEQGAKALTRLTKEYLMDSAGKLKAILSEIQQKKEQLAREQAHLDKKEQKLRSRQKGEEQENSSRTEEVSLSFLDQNSWTRGAVPKEKEGSPVNSDTGARPKVRPDSVREAKQFLQKQSRLPAKRQEELQRAREKVAASSESVRAVSKASELTRLAASRDRLRQKLSAREAEPSPSSSAEDESAVDTGGLTSEDSGSPSSGISSANYKHRTRTRYPENHHHHHHSSKEILNSLRRLNDQVQDIKSALGPHAPAHRPLTAHRPLSNSWSALFPPPPNQNVGFPAAMSTSVPHFLRPFRSPSWDWTGVACYPPVSAQPTLVEKTSDLRQWLQQAKVAWGPQVNLS